MRYLIVGDPHVTVEELDDAQALMDGVYRTFEEQKPDYLVIMGDLHHNHAVVRVEVTDFWLRNLSRFPKDKTILLVGNHDRPNDSSSTVHALQPYKNLATVVDKTVSIGDATFVPYYHSREEFVNEINNIKPKILFCHQTFDGSRYENGFFAPDGVDPRMVGVPVVISGHIHTAQVLNWEAGFVQYFGSPRWRTVSDANEEKAIVIYDSSTNVCTAFSTSGWCRPIGSGSIRDISELSKIPFASNVNAKLMVSVHGPKAEVDRQIAEGKKLKKNIRLTPVYTDQTSKVLVSESAGIGNALTQFVESYKPQFGTPKEHLIKMVAMRCQI